MSISHPSHRQDARTLRKRFQRQYLGRLPTVGSLKDLVHQAREWARVLLNHGGAKRPRIFMAFEVNQGHHHRQRGIESDLGLRAVNAPEEVGPGRLIDPGAGAVADLVVNSASPYLSFRKHHRELRQNWLDPWIVLNASTASFQPSHHHRLWSQESFLGLLHQRLPGRLVGGGGVRAGAGEIERDPRLRRLNAREEVGPVRLVVSEAAGAENPEGPLSFRQRVGCLVRGRPLSFLHIHLC